MQAMIFAAGKGTRLKPLTDVIPKALVPVGDVPLIQRVMQKLVDGGATRIVVNIHHHAPQLENYLSLLQLKYPSVEILISDESRELLDTGGGIKQARPPCSSTTATSSAMSTSASSTLRPRATPLCSSPSARRSVTSASTMTCAS